jgi:hypothetical protein
MKVSVRRRPHGLTIVAASALFARRHFAVDLDQFNKAFDAEVGEGHDALLAEPLDPDHAIFRLHFQGDVEEEVDVFAEVLCDKVYGPDVGDLIEVHGSGRERRDGLRQRSPVPRQQFIEPMRGMGGDAREDVGEPRLRIDAVHLGGDDQAVHDRGPPASAVGAAEQP